MPDLSVRLGALTLRNPVLAAAGTFGYGIEFAGAVPLNRLGGLVTKTLTRHPREGNPPPRLVETPSGLLNAVGLQNVGLDAFLRDTLPQLRSHDVPVIVSLLGRSPEELGEMVELVDRAEGAAAIELNLSCPNIKRSEGSGLPAEATEAQAGPRPKMVAQDPEATEDMVAAARAKTRKPLLAKLSPEVTDLAPIAQAAERAGADVLSLVNTFVGMSLDPETRRSRLGVPTGGLSGSAIRPLAVYRVWYTAQTVRLPIIGLGGIVRAEDAVEFIAAGATAVAVGTANFADPRAALRVVQGLERYLERHRIRALEDIRGCAHRAKG